jgi:cell division septum initiation protein DivIVA
LAAAARAERERVAAGAARVEWETRRAEADAARLAAAAQVQRARLEADAAVEVARAEAAKAAVEVRLAKLGSVGPRRVEPRPAGSGRTGSRLAPVGDIERRMRAHWQVE